MKDNTALNLLSDFIAALERQPKSVLAQMLAREAVAHETSRAVATAISLNPFATHIPEQFKDVASAIRAARERVEREMRNARK